MPNVFLAAVILCFVVLAPFKVTILTLTGLFLIAAVIKATAEAVTDATFTYGEALRAVGYSAALVLLALFTLFSFVVSGGQASGMAGMMVFAAFFAAYVLGFSIGLGTTFGSSAIIALISTVISVVLFFVGRSVL